MGIKEKLNRLIFVEDPANPTNKPQEKVQEKSPPEKVSYTTPSPPPIENDSSLIDQKICEVLRARINENRKAFSQFFDMVASLEEVISDEPTRYAAAMKAVTKQGITPSQIISEIEGCFSIIDAERAQLERVLKDKESLLDDSTKQIDLKNKEIEEATKRLGQLQAEKSAIEQKIRDETIKIVESKKKVEMSINIIRKEITGQKEIISKYIK